MEALIRCSLPPSPYEAAYLSLPPTTSVFSATPFLHLCEAVSVLAQ